MLVRKENKIIRQKGRVVEDAEWDRDEVYSIIMNNEGLYKQAMNLCSGNPKTAIRKLKSFAKEVGMDTVPKIRLSDKGALLVAARILEDA